MGSCRWSVVSFAVGGDAWRWLVGHWGAGRQVGVLTELRGWKISSPSTRAGRFASLAWRISSEVEQRDARRLRGGVPNSRPSNVPVVHDLVSASRSGRR